MMIMTKYNHQQCESSFRPVAAQSPQCWHRRQSCESVRSGRCRQTSGSPRSQPWGSDLISLLKSSSLRTAYSEAIFCNNHINVLENGIISQVMIIMLPKRIMTMKTTMVIRWRGPCERHPLPHLPSDGLPPPGHQASLRLHLRLRTTTHISSVNVVFISTRRGARFMTPALQDDKREDARPIWTSRVVVENILNNQYWFPSSTEYNHPCQNLWSIHLKSTDSDSAPIMKISRTMAASPSAEKVSSPLLIRSI